jgi:NAD-dependent dihydropyrimidine dehydrogenase PreA subunit
VKKRILENPACKNKICAEKDQHGVLAVGMSGLKDRPSVVSGSSIDKDSKDRIVTAVIQGVIESSHMNQEDRNMGEAVSHNPSQCWGCAGSWQHCWEHS